MDKGTDISEASGQTGQTSECRPQDAPNWRSVFLDGIAAGMSAAKACRAACVHETTVYRVRRQNEAFRREWNRAADIGTRLLEQEAQRRAYHGTETTVWYKGQPVGTEQRHSDALLIFLLKARRPAVYRDDAQRGGSINVSVQVNAAAVELLNALPIDALDLTVDLPVADTTTPLDASPIPPIAPVVELAPSDVADPFSSQETP